METSSITHSSSLGSSTVGSPATASASSAAGAKAVSRPLLLNAAFSLLNGLVLSIAPGMVGDWLAVNVDGWLRLFGIALLGHALVLAWAASRPDARKWAQINLAMIGPYPLMMAGLLVFGLIDRTLGQFVVAADGVVMAFIAMDHWRQLRKSR